MVAPAARLVGCTMIAALFVAKGGAYFGLEGVDPWDEARDARKYAGPHPVVAHPPCSRWCRLAGLVEARWGKRCRCGTGKACNVRGHDGGCFAAALSAVRRFGGVLEHPAYSDAWAAFGLPVPPRTGGWIRTLCGGWTCHVEQGRYGHIAKKATWLYAVVDDPPPLLWGSTPDTESKVWVSWCGNHTRGNPRGSRPRVGAKRGSATPADFRAALLEIARSARRTPA